MDRSRRHGHGHGPIARLGTDEASEWHAALGALLGPCACEVRECCVWSRRACIVAAQIKSKKDGMKRGWMMIDGTKLNRKGVGLLLRKVRRAVG